MEELILTRFSLSADRHAFENCLFAPLLSLSAGCRWRFILPCVWKEKERE